MYLAVFSVACVWPHILLGTLHLGPFLFRCNLNAQWGSQAEAKLLTQGSLASGSPTQGIEGGGGFLAESGPSPPVPPHAGARQPGAT